ncbi:MAG: hypothetical protein ACRCX8_12785 [Sarcina sp.]
MDYNERLVLPEYPEVRSFLKEPDESAFIADMALGLESELTYMNTIIGFESLELTPNVCVQLSMEFGLEASKFAETAKRTYYMFKQRAKQLVTYIFNFFLEMLRGSTDVKALLKSYASKTEKYIEAFDKMRLDFSDDNKLDIRDVNKRVKISLSTIETTCIGLDNLLIQMHNLGDKEKVETKILKFIRGLQFINATLDVTKMTTSTVSKEAEVAFMKEVKTNIIDRFKDNNTNVSDEGDITKKMDAKIEELKKVFKSDVQSTNMTYKDAYEYILSGLKFVQRRLEGMDNEDYWDFKSIAKKINIVKDELLKELDGISNEKNLNDSANDKDLATAIKNIMSTGKYMSKTKDVIAISLSGFKSDIEVMFTETKKIGSVLYQKQQ